MAPLSSDRQRPRCDASRHRGPPSKRSALRPEPRTVRYRWPAIAAPLLSFSPTPAIRDGTLAVFSAESRFARYQVPLANPNAGEGDEATEDSSAIPSVDGAGSGPSRSRGGARGRSAALGRVNSSEQLRIGTSGTASGSARRIHIRTSLAGSESAIGTT